MSYLKDRFGEASTWRGIFAALTGVGVAVSPDLQEAIIAAGLSVIGLIGILTKDKAEK